MPRPDAGPPGGEWSDGDLVSRSLSDPQMFGEVYRRHADGVHRFVAGRLGTDLAEEVTAETFITAFRIRSRFDLSRESARPWLMGIAVKEISRRKRAERTRYRMLASLPPQPFQEGPEQVAELGLRAPIATALRRLRPADRDVLLLMAWADLSYAEAAEALQIPVGTVRSRLHRARQVLRAVLPDKGDLVDSKEESWTS